MSSWIKSAFGGGVATPPPELEYANWSGSFTDAGAHKRFAEGILHNLVLPGEVTAMACEPVLGYLAVGTTTGTLHLYGSPPVQLSITLRPAVKVKHLLFKSGSPLLICIDAKDTISVYDLSRPDPQVASKTTDTSNPFQPLNALQGGSQSGPPHPETPTRIAAHSARNEVICVELSPSHDHLFLGMRDGTIDCYDLTRLQPSPYRIPNLWWEEEEILRKSGVPDAPSRRHVPLVVQIETHPKNLTQLLIAYEGGVVLLDLKTRTVLRTYQLRLLPGAPGAGGGDPNQIWTERSSAVTSITWRPDGDVFAVGHEDGCISFWHVKDDGKPLLVRTLDRMDVDRPQVPDGKNTNGPEQAAPPREPIFKITWTGFPEQSWLEYASKAVGSRTPSGSVVPPTEKEAAEKAQDPQMGTVVTILGGVVPFRDAPGLTCLHMPPYAIPKALWGSSASTPEALSKVRAQLRASLDTTRESRYNTPSPVEDFLLVPKNNPHYSMNYDPQAIITLLAAEPNLPSLPPPAAARGLKCYPFPPPRASDRKSRASLPPTGSLMQQPAPEMQLPLPLSFTGSGAILGATLETLSVHSYRKLGGKCSEISGALGASANLAPQLVDGGSLTLKGGKAYPIVSGDPSLEPEMLAKRLSYRVLITWHLDGTVRFHDASPHLLLHTPKGTEGTDAAVPAERPLEHPFPAPLPHLTISSRDLIHHPHLTGNPSVEPLKVDSERLSVIDVKLATEMLELAIILRSGKIIYFKHGFARARAKDAVVEDVAQELQRNAAFASIPPVQHAHTQAQQTHRSSPSVTSSLSQEARLDAAMSDALSTMNMQPTPSNQGPGPGPVGVTGTPVRPPRPPRDPNRPTTSRNESPANSPLLSNCRFEPRQPLTPPQSTFLPGFSPGLPPSHMPPPRMLAAQELTDITHLSTWHADGFKPFLLIDLNRGDCTSVAVSDIGFFAAACGSALALIDLRGQELIVRDSFGDTVEPEDASREERKAVEAESKSIIHHLTFAITRVASDPRMAPRLLVSRENGLMSVWTITQTLDQWLASRSSAHKLDGTAHTQKVMVCDANGFQVRSTGVELQRAQREIERGGPTENDAVRCGIAIFISRGMVTLRYGIDGPVIAKEEINDRILGANIVERNMERVLLVITAASIFIYTLPHLDLIDRKQRHHRDQGMSSGYALRACADISGDFIDLGSSLDVRLWTIFATQPRPGPPSYLLHDPGLMTPIHPGVGASSVAAAVTGWFSSKSGAVTTGGQLDEILAGANRPPPAALPEPLGQRASYRPPDAKSLVNVDAQGWPIPESASGTATIGGRNPVPYSKSAAGLTTAQSARDQASWNVDLAKQRGEMMNSLEEGLSNLERGASQFSRNLKNMALQSAAKDRIKSLF
ncbi:hypothetical protein K437DRAFT_25519 [Tilletiaria anomala UBC 951]|uniref:Uncharacterized protein n=1 Tax=Tilletiaria anomala (strain ATCC 24038 / CBS 436.72 / UBC 951) TaxID=1037660 RepID=A0A066WE75_TILAU|nr:uncharacterized protein K437DRAFT_25519 [Tilletiaria anomala UBC 951]KDN52257.1 hypothetical protein K437DRAFT_25519 [Tilletiaria anomala UBC 951]